MGQVRDAVDVLEQAGHCAALSTVLTTYPCPWRLQEHETSD